MHVWRTVLGLSDAVQQLNTSVTLRILPPKSAQLVVCLVDGVVVQILCGVLTQKLHFFPSKQKLIWWSIKFLTIKKSKKSKMWISAVSLVFCHCKWNMFGIWTVDWIEQVILRRHLRLWEIVILIFYLLDLLILFQCLWAPIYVVFGCDLLDDPSDREAVFSQRITNNLNKFCYAWKALDESTSITNHRVTFKGVKLAFVTCFA